MTDGQIAALYIEERMTGTHADCCPILRQPCAIWIFMAMSSIGYCIEGEYKDTN